MSPCRIALKDLMKELLTAIPEILLARDTPLLEAYQRAVDALAMDDVWDKQMQDYMRLSQQQAQKPIYVQPNTTLQPGVTWTVPITTTNTPINYGGG